MKKRIVITGEKVNDVGYRPFLLAAAESLEIERFFADNTPINGKNGKQEVYALVDSSREKVAAFLEDVSSRTPANSRVEKIEDEDYEGRVMKTEGYYRYLTAMQLSKIATYGGAMLDKQDLMLEGQEKMLGKQDLMLEGQEKTRGKLDAIKSAVDHGFSELKEEHVKTREMSMEIFHSEVQGLHEEINFLRSSVEEIRKKVGIT